MCQNLHEIEEFTPVKKISQSQKRKLITKTDYQISTDTGPLTGRGMTG